MSDAKDLIAQIMDRSRRGGPKGPRGTPTGPTFQPKVLLLVVAVLVIAWGALTTTYTVQPDERAVIKRFGRVVDIAGPGLHFKLPFGIEQRQLVATERVLKEEFGYRTADSSGDRSRFNAGQLPGRVADAHGRSQHHPGRVGRAVPDQ